jgi:hypothetical protein
MMISMNSPVFSDKLLFLSKLYFIACLKIQICFCLLMVIDSNALFNCFSMPKMH